MSDSKDHSSSANMSKILVCVLLFISLFTLCGAIWTLAQFGNLSLDEIIFELSAPLSGTGNGMIPDFIIKCVLVPAVIAVGMFLVLKKTNADNKIKTVIISVSFFIQFASLFVFLKEAGIYTYISGKTKESDFVEKNYIDPSNVNITFPENKKNLVMIYAESMEDAYADKESGGAFDDNRIPHLTELAKENTDFRGDKDVLNGGYAMPGTTWTMAGLFATSSGLPIKMSIGENDMSVAEHFFPNIITLGDILEKEGYDQYFVLGSDATFGGRDSYFKDHGNFTIKDVKAARNEGFIHKDYDVFWGMEDEKLFSYAKQTIEEAATNNRPINVTMITMDTHFPGYTCDLCEDVIKEKKTSYGDVLYCSSKQINEFVMWLKQQPCYENTVIVITGDHPTMEEGYVKVSDDYIRKTYTCFINAAKTPAEGAYRDYSTFDIFPTVISALGASIEGDRLGLGTDLFSENKTLSEEYGFEKEAQELNKNSKFLKELESPGEEIEKIEESLKGIDKPMAKRKKAKTEKGNDTEEFEVSVSDLSKMRDDIVLVEIRITGKNGNVFEKVIKRMDEKEDGTYHLKFKTKKFLGIKNLRYDILVTVPLDKDKGTAVTVNVSK